MFPAENRQAALEAARRAHHYHFGMMHDYFILQDKPNMNITLSRPITMRPPLTYTAGFVLPSPPPTSSNKHHTATELAKPSTTDVTFTCWLPWVIPLDTELPVRCTAPDCPLAYLFHYEGVFVVERENLDAPPRSRTNYSPSKIWEAQMRVNDWCPTDEDLIVIDDFKRYHYWYNRRREYPQRLLSTSRRWGRYSHWSGPEETKKVKKSGCADYWLMETHLVFETGLEIMNQEAGASSE